MFLLSRDSILVRQLNNDVAQLTNNDVAQLTNNDAIQSFLSPREYDMWKGIGHEKVFYAEEEETSATKKKTGSCAGGFIRLRGPADGTGQALCLRLRYSRTCTYALATCVSPRGDQGRVD